MAANRRWSAMAGLPYRTTGHSLTGAGTASPGPAPPHPPAAVDSHGYQSVTWRPMTVKRVGIVGSGIMGSGVAELAAKHGYEVVLRSRRRESADAMGASLDKSLD